MRQTKKILRGIKELPKREVALGERVREREGGGEGEGRGRGGQTGGGAKRARNEAGEVPAN
jgi:hypothetical protein